jgi:predicted pyridoxine 5'-phosphate oxidase superfamily flavin-nucleotide-binding protein
VSTISLRDVHLCFEGAVPAVIATASSQGAPNVTYLSRVRLVDDERVALSNQFFSKTARNLVENPRASVLVLDPLSYDEYRLTLVYERTERRGLIFDRLRADVDAVAAVSGMQDVFKLRAADIYRVVDIEHVTFSQSRDAGTPSVESDIRRLPRSINPDALAELTGRLGRCSDLDSIVSTTVDGLGQLLEYHHSLLLLLDETGTRLFTIASHGYPAEGVGSEVVVGEGHIGMAAERVAPVRVGNLRQMVKYGATVRRSFEDVGEIGPGREIPVPGLVDAESRLAVPCVALGQLVGILVVESHRPVAFDESDQALLSVIAAIVANAVEAERARDASDDTAERAPRAVSEIPAGARSTHVRFFAVDGSTFVGGDYLIKGVAGRILWSLLGHYTRERRVDFTNKEIRLEPSLELPEFRDNLDSRLILLKRRLEERDAPIRIEKTGRGSFRLQVDGNLRLDEVAAPSD